MPCSSSVKTTVSTSHILDHPLPTRHPTTPSHLDWSLPSSSRLCCLYTFVFAFSASFLLLLPYVFMLVVATGRTLLYENHILIVLSTLLDVFVMYIIARA
ncbi:hypothetical protein C8Q78DRAFT_1058715 [Trametes maxima]|nr:hypothetical protein C8Q78DRAFT_1058715 [Trametes maxima]